jgi:putative flippase GtrA
MPLILIRFIKFSLVGFSGLIIDFGTTYFLKEKLKVQKYFANSTGFILAATSNYVLNRIWTFENSAPEIFEQYTKFVLIALIGLGINNLIIYFLNDRKGINFYVSKLAAIIIVVIWNFGANTTFTFT